MGTIVMIGLEWEWLRGLVSYMLRQDDSFRAIGKTLFFNRKWVESALEALEKAKRTKRYVLYIETTWEDHPSQIRRVITDCPERFKKVLAKNETLLASVPFKVRVKADRRVILGLISACCKAICLNKALKKIGEQPILSEEMEKVVWHWWKRFCLHFRRSIGAKKAAWRKKGWIVDYEEVPDLRDEEFHEGSKLLYEIEEDN